MKTQKPAAALYAAALALLMAGCQNLEVVNDPTGGEGGADPLEMRLETGFVTGNDTRAVTRAGEGMINGSALAQTLDIALARVNEGAGGYAAQWGTTQLDATIETTKKVTFDKKQYYSPAGLKTKLIGWYPAVDATYNPDDGGNATVSWTAIDGKTDILVSDLREGSKLNPFTAAQTNVLTFKHALTQIQIKAYALSQEEADIWGTVDRITITDKKQTCKITLPATSAETGDNSALTGATFTNDADGLLELVKENPAGNTPLTDMTVGVSVAGDTGDGQGDGTDKATVAKLWGYAMFAPVAAQGSLTLTIHFTAGGTKEVVIPGASSGDPLYTNGLRAGYSHLIYLKFGLSAEDEIVPEVEITDWIEGDEIEIPV